MKAVRFIIGFLLPPTIIGGGLALAILIEEYINFYELIGGVLVIFAFFVCVNCGLALMKDFGKGKN